ncbi:GIY-YIG nuclease family protein [Natronomonas sp.]|uniref:GIY-YIG nuclease family protein n=1 Tax=Natronomonas sp. TaxID=2184060 RepID=UPI00397574D3
MYCMYDLDGKPAYAGKTSGLRGRLRQHFIRQDSSVVSYGRLDIWDIAAVDW